MYHLCGQGCAMKAMERFMTAGVVLPSEMMDNELASSR
jgi:hypothetical protein